MKLRISNRKIAVAAVLLAVMQLPMTLKAESPQETVGVANETVRSADKEARKAARRTMRGYKAFVEAGTFLNISSSELNYPIFGDDPVRIYSMNGNKIELMTVHGYQVNNFLFVGGGLALNWCTDERHFSLPIFADVRVNLLNRKVSPFVDVKFGWAVGEYKGLYAACSAGCRIAVAGRSAIFGSVEFYTQRNMFLNYDEGYFFQGIGLKVGYEF